MSEDKRAITGYGPVISVILTVLIFLVPQIFVGLGLSLLWYLQIGFDQESIGGYFVLDCLVELATLAILYFFLRINKITFKQLIGKLRDIVLISWAPVAFLLYVAALTAVLNVVGQVFPLINLDQEQQNPFKGAVGAPEIVLAFIALVVITPIVEELVFRGFLYRGLRSKLSWLWAAIITSVLFATAHGQLNVGIDTFVLSIFLTLLVERTNSLIPAMVLHGIKNLVAFVVIFYVQR